jgi:hypothetical protein
VVLGGSGGITAEGVGAGDLVQAYGVLLLDEALLEAGAVPWTSQGLSALSEGLPRDFRRTSTKGSNRAEEVKR